MTDGNGVSGTHIGTYRRQTFKVYPKQIGDKWIATWTLTRIYGDKEEFPARGEFETIKEAIFAATRDAEERIRELERGFTE